VSPGVVVEAEARWGADAVAAFVTRHGADAESRLVEVLASVGCVFCAEEPAQESPKNSAQESPKNWREKWIDGYSPEPPEEPARELVRSAYMTPQEFAPHHVASWTPRHSATVSAVDESLHANRLVNLGASCRTLPSASPQVFGRQKRGARR